jgi:hypothetical protein
MKRVGDFFRLDRFLARYRCPYVCKKTRVFEWNVVWEFEAIGEELWEIF